ncbi:MAG TPA: NAD(P)H-dependent glycerol-3-phosphate dehydrogenase [Tissierellaceae bacterium]|nr:NAD(P)H-dependent glycerol-3-phosphate dehydrogenase [Tissierellaceae bacterium]
MKEKIGVLGGGSWGTALAILLAKKGNDVTIWLRDKRQADSIKQTMENKKYLPNIKLPDNISLSIDLEEVNYNKDLILLSVPTHGIREVLNSCKNIIKKEQIIVNVSKGIENQSLLRISEIVEEFLPNNKYAVLSGPSHAEEVARNMATAVVSASKYKNVAEYIQDLFIAPNFRVYTNPDVIGVELGGALKNIIALGAGISDGLKYGDNTKAALMTRGITEISRLGVEVGAKPETFFGLSGIGDLIVTCTSMHSRNRRAGILIGEGIKSEEVIKKIGMVVEGIKTTKSAFYLAQEYDVDMPITNELYDVLYEEKNVRNSVANLMLRDKKHEMEDIVSDKKFHNK